MKFQAAGAGHEQSTGYAHRGYAESLAEWGTPYQLANSNGWILERPIAGTDYRDGMGCYPLFACSDWTKLHQDVEALSDRLVSLSLVTDPFGNFTEKYLRDCFIDRVVPFKEHFVADLNVPAASVLSKHHRYYAKRALADVSVAVCDDPHQFLDDWTDLYAVLTAQHGLTGIKAFSRKAFAHQFSIPGLVMLRATAAGKTVGAHLWFVQNDVAHSHLAAVNADGYKLMAAYGLYRSAFDIFAGKVRWLNFGAGAGLATSSDSGLTRFKRGWATVTRTAYFCARIFDRPVYEKLSAEKASDTSYFPAYRTGELA